MHVGNIDRGDRSANDELKVDGVILNGPCKVANEFNNYFYQWVTY